MDNFDEYEPEGAEYPFILAGRTWHARPAEEFTISELGRLMGASGPVRNSDFFAAVLRDDEGADMVALLSDPETAVKRGQIDAAVRACYTHITGLPTTPPATSTPGPAPTASKSAGGSSSQGKTRKRTA